MQPWDLPSSFLNNPDIPNESETIYIAIYTGHSGILLPER